MGSSVNNAKAFEQVFADYKAMIFKIARSYTTNAEVTHDLVQEITLQLRVGFEQYDAQYKPRAWIYRVALNTAIAQRAM